MRILGIDPGFARSGWGIVDLKDGKVRSVAYGCIQTTTEKPIPERLFFVYSSFIDLIELYKPDVFAVEELFFNTNAKSALRVGEARGVCIVAGIQKNLPYAMYTPLQVKSAMTGYGRATKDQIGVMVQNLLKLPSIPTPDDTADALAIALTHAFSHKMAAARSRK